MTVRGLKAPAGVGLLVCVTANIRLLFQWVTQCTDSTCNHYNQALIFSSQRLFMMRWLKGYRQDRRRGEDRFKSTGRLTNRLTMRETANFRKACLLQASQSLVDHKVGLYEAKSLA